MKIVKNIGEKDRKLRFTLAFLFFILFFILPVFKILFLILALVFGVTAWIEFCGIYTLFGINTKKSENQQK